ncbi:MAG: cation:dicarboxylase symporter family transporter, partial [Planctomycetes bacterium]|nr:cation:dicarboxylase symporter family transporter [Planctomycetota bacterium]
MLLSLWALALFSIVLLPCSFPQWKAGSFFSVALIERPPPVDFFSVFIPANFFASLAQDQIPAVVLFCICVGLALGSIPDKEKLIVPLDMLARTLVRVTGFIARLMPAGVFAIAASTSGTIYLDELVRLQAYIAAYTVAAVILTFVVLPLVITTLTPFSYRDVMRVSKDSLITVFATGKLIIVLPILIEQTERLFEQQRPETDDTTVPAVDVLYPLAYAFPHIGKLLGILFIPFAAWFLGSAMTWHEYPKLLGAGLFGYFGGPLLAIPFLLDQMHLPHDMFQLFLLSGVYCERLGDALGAMHLVTFTILTTCAFTGRLRLRLYPILRLLGIFALLAIATVAALRVGLRQTVRHVADREEIIARMQLLEEPVASKVFREASPNPDPRFPGETLLARMRRRGVIRIGYNEDKLPFAYFNTHGELVGFDISMAHALARDLGVGIEFVRFDRDRLAEQLADDCFDVVMSGLVATLERAEKMQHTGAVDRDALLAA